MRKKVIKTTFEEEQRMKDEAFLRLTPLQRLAWLLKMQKAMRKPGINYSYNGAKVTIKRIK